MSHCSSHTPVLLSEVLEGLSLRKGETVLDVTVGLGGHGAAFLEAVGESGRLIALDADEQNLREAQHRLASFPGQGAFHHRNFREIPDMEIPACDALFADLGLSSPHLDDPERGFSFRFEGPLDLRFDRTQGETAAERILRASEDDLMDVLLRFGEVRCARSLAREIVQRRPETTQALRACVESVAGFRAKAVLPQVFQALRIAVNDELGALRILLAYGPKLLKPGGRMAVISFHSLEDRMVKKAFRALSTPTIDAATGAVSLQAPFVLLTKKAICPCEEEIAKNPRARSARLRILQRSGAGAQ